MDYYGADRKLSELGEQDLEDFLDQDMFTPPSNCQETALDSFGLVDTSDDTPMDNEWLDNFFDDPVLNDRMMTDALQPRRVQSEHSYSLTNGNKIIIDGEVKPEITEKDMEVDLLGSAINPNMTMTSGPTTSIINTTYIDTTSPAPAQINLKHEPSFSQHEITLATNSIAPTPTPIAMTTMRTNTHPVHPQTLLKQPTIILATTQNSVPPLGGDSIMPSIAPVKHERYVLPKVNIKVEPYDTASNMSSPEHSSESSYQGYESTVYAESGVSATMDDSVHRGHVQVMYDSIGLPPTPPSSSNSDSEGGLSPQRSAPPSPIRHSQLRQHTHTHHTLGGAADALFSSPIPTSGILILSEEEKRTLVTEGYPIPNKLPLTKQEEKNLKKIRRKIKNKISAQESRRKKKEYLETLEKRVEAFNCENSDLKKKVESLENNNRSLLGQLQKLQSLVAKVPRPPTPSSTQTSTCLMVLVLFFAVFMGTWSPMTWSIGYSAMPAVPSHKPHSIIAIHGPTGQPIGPEIQEPVTDAYATPNMRSRVLLSLKEDSEEPFGPYMPFTYNNFFSRWFTADKDSCSGDMDPSVPEADYTIAAPVPEVVAEVNDTDYGHRQYVDISVNYTAQVMTHINTTTYGMVPDLAQNLS